MWSHWREEMSWSVSENGKRLHWLQPRDTESRQGRLPVHGGGEAVFLINEASSPHTCPAWPTLPVLFSAFQFLNSSTPIFRACVCVCVFEYSSVSACVWLCFGEVRCNMGEPLAAPLSRWCQAVGSYTLPLFGPTLPFKHLFAALTNAVEPPQPLSDLLLTLLFYIQTHKLHKSHITVMRFAVQVVVTPPVWEFRFMIPASLFASSAANLAVLISEQLVWKCSCLTSTVTQHLMKSVIEGKV